MTLRIFNRFVAALSQAVADHLRPITDDILDESFAKVDSELINTARQVAQGCNDSLNACKQTQQILMQSGEAGKGFNVVAQEVHQLTRQIGEESVSIQKAVSLITGHCLLRCRYRLTTSARSVCFSALVMSTLLSTPGYQKLSGPEGCSRLQGT